VNSREHEERFAPGGSSNIESTYRTVIPIELDQVENLSGYDEDAVKRLLSGIGLYSPLGQPEPIVEATLDFMAKHYLSHLFSDPAIVYGTNLPIHTVVIDRSYAKTATRNSLLQLIGRAGRTGKTSWSHVVFGDTQTMLKCLDSTRDQVSGPFEARILNELLRKSISIR